MSKRMIGTRLSDAGIEWLDAIATEYQTTRSQVMKVAFWVGREHEDRMRKVLEWEQEQTAEGE